MSTPYSSNKFYSAQEILNSVFDEENGTISTNSSSSGSDESPSKYRSVQEILNRVFDEENGALSVTGGSVPVVPSVEDLPTDAEDGAICLLVNGDNNDEVSFYQRQNGQWVLLQYSINAEARGEVNSGEKNITTEIKRRTDYHFTNPALESLTITRIDIDDDESTVTFTSGETPCVLTLPSDVSAELCEDPQANKKFIMLVRNGVVFGKNITANGTMNVTSIDIHVVQGQAMSDVQLPTTASNGSEIVYVASNVPVGISISSTGFITGTYDESEDVTAQVTASATLCGETAIQVRFYL